ncbi:phosphate-starvation-inducible PsiE family protein [Aquifex pyrophilus]
MKFFDYFSSPEFICKAVDFYNKFVNFIAIFMIPILMLTLLIAVGIIFYDLRLFVEYFFHIPTTQEYDKAFKLLVRNILNFFVLIELFKVFIDVLEYRRIRKRQIIEAGIVFVVREIILIVFEHRFTFTDLVGFGILLFSLGITYMLLEKSYLDYLRFEHRAITEREKKERSGLISQRKDELKR